MFSSPSINPKKLEKSTLANIVKSGYLTKQAKSGKQLFAKRYFVLSESTLTYFLSHKHTDVAKGDILLEPSTTVSVVDGGAFDFGLRVSCNDRGLLLGCQDEAERGEWSEKIERVVGGLKGRCRGNLCKAGRFGRETTCFFLLHR